mgnify:CR=1 FL=1
MLVFLIWLSFVTPGLVIFFISEKSKKSISYSYCLKKKDYIGLNDVIKKKFNLLFNPEYISYDDIDLICDAVKRSAEDIYPVLLNKQVVDDIKFLYRNKIYTSVWPKVQSDPNCWILVPYKAISEYVEEPEFGGPAPINETCFLEICEELKKKADFVK